MLLNGSLYSNFYFFQCVYVHFFFKFLIGRRNVFHFDCIYFTRCQPTRLFILLIINQSNRIIIYFFFKVADSVSFANFHEQTFWNDELLLKMQFFPLCLPEVFPLPPPPPPPSNQVFIFIQTFFICRFFKIRFLQKFFPCLFRIVDRSSSLSNIANFCLFYSRQQVTFSEIGSNFLFCSEAEVTSSPRPKGFGSKLFWVFNFHLPALILW